jgi:hypothetical protein
MLDIETNLLLALGQVEEASKRSDEVQRLLESAPYPFGPEKYNFTHSRVLRALDREAEADDYLYRAYERVKLVANNTRDGELRQSWLENVKVNREILEACKERGIHD